MNVTNCLTYVLLVTHCVINIDPINSVNNLSFSFFCKNELHQNKIRPISQEIIYTSIYRYKEKESKKERTKRKKEETDVIIN